MGDWLFRRSTFGSQSGYAEPWCDLPHWGLVLDGNVVNHWEDKELELWGPGDVFHCHGGPPGHRMEVRRPRGRRGLHADRGARRSCHPPRGADQSDVGAAGSEGTRGVGGSP